MSKWTMPSFLVTIISIIAVACNNKFGWHLSPDKLIASVGVTVNFVIVALANDIAKLRNGERPNWNSTKLVTLMMACVTIGFSQYIGIELDMEEVLYIAGGAAAFITGKGIRDIIQTKLGGASNVDSKPSNTIGSTK